MKNVFFIFSVLVTFLSRESTAQAKWTTLFNGEDLTGWSEGKFDEKIREVMAGGKVYMY